jgi:radical SAM superfamily enzyme YgiQ (UPF0313 family)
MNRKLIEKVDYLLSREKGTVFKDPGGKINIALVYPNTYPVGMSNLGFQGIYGLLNSINDVVCERCFLPSPEEIEEYERTDSELFALESKRSLTRFDIIAFSVSFENDYPNILEILRMSGIPLRSAVRNSSHPLIIMGGVCAFFNPEPLADFFDIVFIGEAEEMLPEFISAYRMSETKHSVLERSLRIDGAYVPRNYSVKYSGDTGQILERKSVDNAPEIIGKRTVKDISSCLFRPVIITPEAEFSDMYLLEAMRGCPWSCRFCVAGHIYNPPRKKDLDTLRNEIKGALSKTCRVGLIGPSLSDYPHVEEALCIEGVDFSITSLRASPKSGRIVALMRGRKSVSIAPEAGTQRLRNVINKKITGDDIFETAKLILGEIETLRLYFMVGLPTETREDIKGVVDIVKGIRERCRKGFINLSVSTFVPKPFTPFQWHPMTPLREVKERLKLIKKALFEVKGVRVFHDVPKYSYMQGMFSLGDRRVSALIEKVALEGDMGRTYKTLGETLGMNIDYYIFRKKDIAEILPWDFIDAGVSKEKLWKEYLKAVALPDNI